MVQFLVSLMIMPIWILIANFHNVNFPWWVWVINGVISALAAIGIINLGKE